MRRLVPVAFFALAAAVAIGAARPSQPSGIKLDRLYPLRAEEGVFAYARISPNGQTLAYASIMPDETGTWSVRIQLSADTSLAQARRLAEARVGV